MSSTDLSPAVESPDLPYVQKASTGRPVESARRRPLATVLLGLDVAASATVLAVVLVAPASSTGGVSRRLTVVAFVLGTLALAVVGRLVVVRNTEQARIGWLLLAVGVLGALGRALTALALVDVPSTPDLLAWSTNWAWIPGGIAPLLLLLRFPTGALPSPRWRPVELAVFAWGAVAVVVTALTPGALAVTPLNRPNPFGLESAPWLDGALGPLFAVLPVLTVVSAGSLVVRYRSAGAEVRQQLKWVAAAAAVLAIAAPFAAASDGAALLEGFAYLLLPAGLAVAVLRYRLYDLGLVVRRTLVYAIASGLLVAVYVLTVAMTQRVLRGLAPDVVATAVVAVAAVPALAAVRGVVERLLFGDRRDPDRMIRLLGERLDSTPEALLPQVVEQVASSLRLPYVAIELADGSVAAAAGESVADGLRVPLRHGPEIVGWLVAGHRGPNEPLDGRDLVLLQRVASHAGLAVHDSLLSAALQRTSERLRVTRAEERARLQRDLHDELGPALGAIAMRVEAARTLLVSGADIDRIDTILVSVERGAESAVTEVRRIIADLQPQALEELGLHAALRQLVTATPDELTVHLRADPCRPLPPRVELAAYRVAAEALRNVVRHAHARSVWIELRVSAQLLDLTVADDGIGLPHEPRPGVGLESMRTRASELGGTVLVTAREPVGAVVRLRVPLESP